MKCNVLRFIKYISIAHSVSSYQPQALRRLRGEERGEERRGEKREEEKREEEREEERREKERRE